jgi:hypothetical protein
MKKLFPIIRLSFLIMLTLWSSGLVVGQTRLHIYIRAFIPNQHPGNPGYVRSVPGQAGLFVIPSPLPGDTSCFLTDNRMFSNNVNESSRALTEFVLVISDNTVTIEKAEGREIQRTGPTHRVDCQTGSDLVPSQTASTSNMHIGAPAIANGIVQVAVDGRANNPLVIPSPDIKYSGTFTFDLQKNTLRFQGSTGIFPAYESYAQMNGGPIVTLFQNLPAKNSTAVDLIDFGTGIKLQSVDNTVTLQDNLTGKWESTDADRRFLLEITGTTVKWTERGTASTTPGATNLRTVTLISTGRKFRIERANDAEVLTFLGFQPQSLRDAILARSPQPSFIVLTRNGDTLSAEWNGFLVTKNPNGTLKDVIQPGVRPPKLFTFKRIP